MKLGDKTALVGSNSAYWICDARNSCVDPKNYDHDMGCQICVDKIKNKLWPMLGFVLQWAKNGLAPLPEVVLTPTINPDEQVN